MFGPVTDAERRGWQRRNAVVLVDLLAAAASSSLSPITWQVTVGDHTGRCAAPDPARCRADFEAWAAFLGPDVQRWPENEHGGRTHLHVTRPKYAGRVDVTVIADIDEEDEQPQ